MSLFFVQLKVGGENQSFIYGRSGSFGSGGKMFSGKH